MVRRHLVATDYECAYPEPLSAVKGSKLTVLREDGEWPGWVWCTDASGTAGWVPHAWLRVEDSHECTLTRDYSARELTVKSGELVTVSFTESGWAWVSNAFGRSWWLPLKHLVLE